MKAIFSVFVLLTTILFRICFSADLYEGDKCSFKDGSKGTCKFITDCQTTLQLLHTEITPQLCGFVGMQSIVCCKDEVTVPTRSPGDISKKKCKDYAKYAYDTAESPTLSIVTQYSNTLECAFEKEQLIVGGTLATREEFPHMHKTQNEIGRNKMYGGKFSLKIKYSNLNVYKRSQLILYRAIVQALIGYQFEGEVLWRCGGALISENFVLTAAHCLSHIQLGSAALVRVGMTNRTDLAHMQERKIEKTIAHPEYVKTRYHDIGLLRLSEEVELDIYARPACLHTERNIPSEKAIASGWGDTEYGGRDSNDLLKVVLEFFSSDKCNLTHKNSIVSRNSILRQGIIDDYMLCAGSSKDVKDTCQGDSGGPLQIYHDESKGVKCMYDIVGVTSFGRPCGLSSNVPGVYTRVSHYIKWIEDVVWPNLKP